MKITQSNLKSIFLQLFGFMMYGCNLFGHAPIGMGYFSAVYTYSSGNMRALSFIVSALAMAYNMSYVNIYKYIMAMILFALFVSFVECRHGEITDYSFGVLTAGVMFVFEATDVLTSYKVYSYDLGMVAGVSVLAGALSVIFRKGIDGMMREDRFSIENEEMIGIASIAGICAYYLANYVELPYSISQSLIFLGVLFFSYKYGAGYGSIVGAAMGVTLGVICGSAQVVGVMCIAAIVAGAFRELGKIMTAIATMATVIAGSILCAGSLFDKNYLLGMLTGTVIFLLLPYEYEAEEESYDKVFCQNLVNGRLTKLSDSIDALCACSEEVPGEFLGATNDKATSVWQERCNDIRNNIKSCLFEVSGMVDGYSKNINDSFEDEDVVSHSDILRKRLRKKGIILLEMSKIVGEGSVSAYQLTMKCINKKVVTTSEICRDIECVTGEKVVVDKTDSLVVGNEYRTFVYRAPETYSVEYGVSESVKGGSRVSGDTHSFKPIGDGRVMLTVADGMGSGVNALRESEKVVGFLEKLIGNGCSEKGAINMVNSMKSINWSNDRTTSVDMGVIDTYSGMCDFMKMGAASTFVKRGKWVDVIRSTSLPIGAVEEADIDTSVRKLYSGDVVIMVTDGVLDGIKGENKEELISKFIMSSESSDPQQLADELMDKVLSESMYIPSDDMTVVVAKLEMKKSA